MFHIGNPPSQPNKSDQSEKLTQVTLYKKGRKCGNFNHQLGHLWSSSLSLVARDRIQTIIYVYMYVLNSYIFRGLHISNREQPVTETTEYMYIFFLSVCVWGGGVSLLKSHDDDMHLRYDDLHCTCLDCFHFIVLTVCVVVANDLYIACTCGKVNTKNDNNVNLRLIFMRYC